MRRFFHKIFSPVLPSRLEDDEKVIARDGTNRQRRFLAQSEKTAQEVLYYLAEHDPLPEVRLAVAKNPSTPLQAAPILAVDKTSDVRHALARRLVKILPSLEAGQYSQLYAFAVQSLSLLALDEVLKVRKALAETLKDYAGTPPAVALQLAKDLEREVSEPILRFCTALSDANLIEVLQSHPAPWAAEAVARRERISDRVGEAIIEQGTRKAGLYLLENNGAQITDDLLEQIVQRAPEYPEWHKPIATRKVLPPLMAQKLAAFANGKVRDILLARSDLDKETVQAITHIIERRMAYDDSVRASPHAQDPAQRAALLFKEGALSEPMLSDALAMRDDRFVIEALALLAAVRLGAVEAMLDVRAPKAICALSWKAGLSMRFALQLQQTLGRVKPSALIYPRGGEDYPFSPEDMRWQLDMMGIGD